MRYVRKTDTLDFDSYDAGRNSQLMKVDHLDHQVQVYDLRQSNFDKPAVMEFGYRASTSSMKPRDRFQKGSTSHSLFSRGYNNGTLCIFDYRNTAVCRSLVHLIRLHGPYSGLRQNVVSKRRRREDPIVHSVFSGDQVIAYGRFEVTFWALSDFGL